MKRLLKSEPLQEKQEEDNKIRYKKESLEWKLADIINKNIEKLKPQTNHYDLFWDVKVGDERMFNGRTI